LENKIYRIALALILFQLMSCAKQSVVTTRPEDEQEQETLQHDTPQVHKTNYLKRGAYIGGVILTILASIGLIAYCCRQKKEEKNDDSLSDTDDELLTDPMEQAKKIAEEISEEDEEDIEIIVPLVVSIIQTDYPEFELFICEAYHPHSVKLATILRWHLLAYASEGTIGARPGETNLSLAREYVTYRVDEEIEQIRRNNPNISIVGILSKIDTCPGYFVARNKQSMEDTYLRNVEKHGNQRQNGVRSIMDDLARLAYYYELKEALRRDMSLRDIIKLMNGERR